MHALIPIIVVVGIVVLIGLALAVHIVHQYERGVVFRFGRVIGEKAPGIILILPIVNVLRSTDFRTCTLDPRGDGAEPSVASPDCRRS